MSLNFPYTTSGRSTSWVMAAIAVCFATGCVEDKGEPDNSSFPDSGEGTTSGSTADSGSTTDTTSDSGSTTDTTSDSGSTTDTTSDSGSTTDTTSDSGSSSTADSGSTADSASDCFSPTHNLDIAHEPGAVGCECEEQDVDRCTNGVALLCDEGTWSAVEDEACVAHECAGEIVDTSADCLQDDAYCKPMPDGSYCTGPAEPQCPIASQPIDKAEACPANAHCFDYSESLRCQRRLFTPQQCEEFGGVVTGEGDGGVLNSGCPEGDITLGGIDGDSQEGALCCASVLAEECRPQDIHRIGECEPPARFHWNGRNCIASSGCSCQGEDCDADFGSKEECESAFDSCLDEARSCGGDSPGGSACGLDEYCAYQPEQECGATDAPAVCIPRPEVCTDHYDPVCGCDHQRYSNSCVAAAAGVGILNYGDCPQ